MSLAGSSGSERPGGEPGTWNKGWIGRSTREELGLKGQERLNLERLNKLDIRKENENTLACK